MRRLSRRNFIKVGGIGFGLAITPGWRESLLSQDFPAADNLGRVCSGRVDIKADPDINSETVGLLYDDAVVEWQYEVTGWNPTRINQRFVKTPDGYVWSPFLQPVKNLPNLPVTSLPETSLGAGMWVEVTVPYVDLVLDNPPARSPWLKNSTAPRFYYSQILWADTIEVDENGKAWYRINERYGYGDIFWADASAFRQIQPEDVSPINPDVGNKIVEVNLTYQTLSCFEGENEVHFCRISSGAKYNAAGDIVDNWATPLGEHPIWRKAMSMHMSGGTVSGGYDLPGIGWTTLFVGNGVAIHSTFWHNNYGVPMSHGCVNAKPEDAKWVFRWVQPEVAYDPGDITVSMPGGTHVRVVE
ncbi:MAG: L,D-transpeptidase [Anaerolineales bacterium]|nr:L,D-transpeptidase [Anaerolineales bacterium]